MLFLILTHFAYIVNGKKSCSNLQQFTVRKYATLFALFYDVILPIDHVSLTV